MTNNYGSDIASPPRTFGLYRDAQRVALAHARSVRPIFHTSRARLPTSRTTIRPHPRVLLHWDERGNEDRGKRRAAARHPGLHSSSPATSTASCATGCGAWTPGCRKPRESGCAAAAPFPSCRAGRSASISSRCPATFFHQDSNNAWSFTTEAFEMYLRSLAKGGILSIPVDISEFNVYALKIANTVRCGPATGWGSRTRDAHPCVPHRVDVPVPGEQRAVLRIRHRAPGRRGARTGRSTPRGTRASIPAPSASGTTCRPSPSSRGRSTCPTRRRTPS